MHASLQTCGRGVKPAGKSAVDRELTPRVRAAIVGTGLLTPLGLSAAETWKSLLAGGFIRAHSPIPLPRGDERQPRVNQLAIHAARQAVRDAGWTAADLASDRTALVVGTSKGPIESWITPALQLLGQDNVYGLADVATDVARDLSFGRGARLTVSAACATGLHALIRASILLESKAATKVLVVAAESSLGPLFTGSFKRLGVLATDACRPFDQHRSGFLMSEAAAAVCLESASMLSPSPCTQGEGRGEGSAQLAPIFIENYALGADATHLTGGDREGESLRHLLQTVLASRPVNFIHAHGTGTQINDATELAAIESVLDQPCPIYSHKAALGHSLGAAGLTAVVLNSLVHATQTIPPNVQTTAPLATRLVRIENGAVHLPHIRRSVVMAAGFGGAAGVLSLVS